MKNKQTRGRSGIMAILAGFMLVFFLAMAAFCVDIGWAVISQSNLQNAADSAALAGAQALMNGYVQYQQASSSQQGTILTNAVAQAKTNAKQYAGLNAAGGVNSLTLNDADIQIGFTDANGNFTAGPPYNQFPNTIKVLMRLDNQANGPLGFFFGPVLGTPSTNLSAPATATIYTGIITQGGGLMLPVALDYNQWVNFVQTGQSPDGNTYNGPNGNPQLQAYPSPGNAPGNFGLVNIGPPSDATPTYRNWIDNGPSSSDIQYLVSNNLMPVSLTNPQPWPGTPGLRSTLGSDFASIIGKPALIPLFQPISTNPYQAAGGQGSNSYYNIVGFAAVTISQATGNGSNMNISIQPYNTQDPGAVYSNVQPAGSGSSGQNSVAVVLPPKLSG